MAPPESTSPSRSLNAGIRVALIIALIGLLFSLGTDLKFYFESARFSPGQEIRPMDVTFCIGAAGSLSIVVGSIASLLALAVVLKRRQWRQGGYAVLACGAAWIPLFAGYWGFHLVVALRHLVLED